jgi:hypothetical protein
MRVTFTEVQILSTLNLSDITSKFGTVAVFVILTCEQHYISSFFRPVCVLFSYETLH